MIHVVLLEADIQRRFQEPELPQHTVDLPPLGALQSAACLSSATRARSPGTLTMQRSFRDARALLTTMMRRRRTACRRQTRYAR